MEELVGVIFLVDTPVSGDAWPKDMTDLDFFLAFHPKASRRLKVFIRGGLINGRSQLYRTKLSACFV
jgi:hypothetical protein